MWNFLITNLKTLVKLCSFLIFYIQFTSDNGRVRVCMSRDEWRPTKDNEGTDGVVCEETSGTFQAPGSTDADVEFKDGKLKKPCSKNKRNGCKPIYLSVTPTEFKSPGQVGLDCSGKN